MDREFEKKGNVLNQEHLGKDFATGVQGDDQAGTMVGKSEGLTDQYGKPVDQWGASGTGINQEEIRGRGFGGYDSSLGDPGT